MCCWVRNSVFILYPLIPMVLKMTVSFANIKSFWNSVIIYTHTQTPIIIPELIYSYNRMVSSRIHGRLYLNENMLKLNGGGALMLTLSLYNCAHTVEPLHIHIHVHKCIWVFIWCTWFHFTNLYITVYHIYILHDN